MRSISLVERLELDFAGNLCRDALCLGDVDNDGSNELILGNVGGQLAIFKKEVSTPWLRVSDLGMIVSLVVGNIFGEEGNSLIVIGGEGLCHILHIEPCSSPTDSNSLKDEVSLPGALEGVTAPRATVVHSQRLQANIKTALLADVDGDGSLELVLGLTDCVVRTYKWVKDTRCGADPGMGVMHGRLVAVKKWELAMQVGAISTNRENNGSLVILAAQPGGTVLHLRCWDAHLPGGPVVTNMDEDGSRSIRYETLASSHLRNPNISSVIIGNIKEAASGEEKQSSLYAVVTLDGTIMLIRDGKILWSVHYRLSMQVDHQLFAMEKVDMTGDGNEEILVCAWDGWTYIIDHNKQSVRFQFEEPVSAFCAGPFGSTGHPALIYATFTNKVYVYHNVELYRIPTMTLEDVVPPSTVALASFLLYDFPLWKKQKELEASMRSLALSSYTTKEEKEEEEPDSSSQER
ncbi:unnamed protein product [Darwinula stevensoni]|uniref:Uncharacterized protein n=1 Tax=Darwinula stevensoni TaxID=69355 RepID=A0A7R8X0G6_9CRUS|nr:unnamed protein product [Darwinula stevensoni]CAG0881198.1 unnamed protein product [Darwinula stevensoni]